MQGFIIKEGFVWLALAALTLFGYFNYESQGSSVAFVVLAAGFAKFLLIFFDFMEIVRPSRLAGRHASIRHAALRRDLLQPLKRYEPVLRSL